MIADGQLLKILSINERGRIKRNESQTLEFKANFSFSSLAQYAKTMAAFANNKGGIIVFGVTDHPRRPIGLANDKFINLDSGRLTEALNKVFEPEIIWHKRDIQKNGKVFGFLVVEESKNKPIIAKATKGEIKEGIIYYRYYARNEPIRYPELSQIIGKIREKERKLWINHIKQIARIGPENAGIFNPEDGLVKGVGGSFLIDKSLLPHVQFIREGHFVEKEESPSLKLIGNVRVIGGDEDETEGIIGIQEKAINQHAIIVNFLNQVKVRSPEEYIKQISLCGIKYLPFYYYCKLARIKLSRLETLHSEIHGYQAILSRAKTDAEKLPIIMKNTGTKAYKEKVRILDQLKDNKLIFPDDRKSLRYLFEVIRTLTDVDLIREVLLKVYRKPLRRIGVIGEFRIAVCYLDYIENKEHLANRST